MVEKIFKKPFAWLATGVSWLLALPTLISPLWTVSGFVLSMFAHLGMVEMFRVFLGIPGPIWGWTTWLRLYVPWIPFITYPATRWLVNSKIPLPGPAWEAAFSWVGGFVIVFGLSLLAVGLAQIAKARIKHAGLVRNGLYGWVRHPQYLGICVWIFGSFLFGLRPLDLILCVTLMFIYLLLAESEERKLGKEFGEEYLEYKNEVSFILPFVPPNSFSWLNSFSQGSKWRKATVYFGTYVLVLISLLISLRAISVPLP